MTKIKINEVAIEIGIPSKTVISKAQEIGLDVKSSNSSIEEKYAVMIMENILNNKPLTPIESTKKVQKTVNSEKIEEKQKKDDSNNNKPIDTVISQKEVVIVKKNPVTPTKIIQKKKKTIPTPIKKKKNVNKIDIISTSKNYNSRDTNDSYDLYLEHEDDVMLLDLNDVLNDVDDTDKLESYNQKKKQNGNNNKKTGQNKPKTSFNNNTRRIGKSRNKKSIKEKVEKVDIIKIPEDIRVYEFAEKAKRSLGEVIKVLFTLGMVVNKNDFLNKDAIDILAEEFELKIETIDLDKETELSHYYNEEELNNKDVRPPIVTIMGHVDHGKTTLLDTIKNSKVVDGEAGGITQHISSYSINVNGKDITFIDTPGHEAFSSIRDRSSTLADIVIIVVAGDDGIKPQTKESLDYVKAKKFPFIVAVNKMDKESFSLDKVKSEFSELGFVASDWGGDIDFIPISALKHQGIDNLLENVLLQAEVLELVADNSAKAKATVLESHLDKNVGINSTIIVNNGTLRVREIVSIGSAYGKIKKIIDDNGKVINEVKPGYTANIFGMNKIPSSGSTLIVCKDEKEAKALATKRYEYEYNKKMSATTKVTLEDFGSYIQEEKKKALKIILKTDTQGALEAITSSIEALNNDEVKAIVIHSAIGTVTENDIIMAGSGDDKAIIIGFNVKPTSGVKNSAKKGKVIIETYSTIYDIIDNINQKLTSMMDKIITYELEGKAEVKEIFKATNIGNIAGSTVIDGVIKHGAKANLVRDGKIICETTIKSLKRFKDDAREVAKGFECGITLEDNSMVQVGDTIESYEKREKEATL